MACPQFCRADAADCCAHEIELSQGCCDHCNAPEHSEANDPLHAPVDTDEPCIDCCLCKGAVLLHGVIDLSPDAVGLVALPAGPAIVSPSLRDDLLRMSAEAHESGGLDARIALGSLLC